VRPSFFHHLHPPTIPAPQARWRYTLGAGGLAVFLSLVLLITGAMEIFYYVPTPQDAASSIQSLTFLVPFGSLVRSLHYWAAQLLVLVVLVHLLRVVFTGAYARPRRFNYLLGVFLLVICLFLDFTGYVLRWDEGIHWALVTGTNLVRSIPIIGPGLYAILVGGNQPGAATLIRFYGWHIFGLALVLILVGGWHLFRVRRDGGVAVPPPETGPDWPFHSGGDFYGGRWARSLVFPVGAADAAPGGPFPVGGNRPTWNLSLAGHHPLLASCGTTSGTGRLVPARQPPCPAFGDPDRCRHTGTDIIISAPGQTSIIIPAAIAKYR
jgi:hypothetical protein